MNIENVLSKIEKQAKDQIAKNKIRINRFVSKYKTARQCFYNDDENDDLYNFLYDISHEYDLPETDIYFFFVECKYTEEGEISKTFEEDFATHITLSETIKNKKQ
jgi:hypothetical protein